ncbi:hypothetical protein ACHAWO_009396 [Cyclotella atomus]|jgi:hypothetical protein|uniref:Uncharacterized protein n=1 Tax=Cyclotella atomus TaxID=382360 RepID=A0ABD3NZC0_9STRA
MVCNPHVCGFYSFTGLIFMSFVYVMLGTQPFFITGIEDVEAAQQNAFGALLTFAGTFIVSLFFVWKSGGDEIEYSGSSDDNNRLNIDLKRDYGAVQTDSY